MQAVSERKPPHPDTSEQLRELLQDLRVAMPSVRVLFVFLLTLLRHAIRLASALLSAGPCSFGLARRLRSARAITGVREMAGCSVNPARGSSVMGRGFLGALAGSTFVLLGHP
jgi:hypothetical protein